MYNPLHKYESYSYHISLRIAPEQVGKQANSTLPSSLGVVIAETGKTAQYFIQQLEVNSLLPAQSAAITTSVTSFNMTIVEQNGFTFIEKYFKGIAQMGWQQPTEAVLFLDISFNGWLPNGLPDSQVNKLSYRVSVVDIQTELDQSRQQYILNLLPVNLYAFEEKELKTNRQFRSEIKKSFIDTITEFQKQFNIQARNVEQAENAPPPPYDEYVFVVGPRLLEKLPEPEMNTVSGVQTQTFMKDPDGKLYYTYCGGDRLDTSLIKIAANIKNIQSVLMPQTKQDEQVDQNAQPSTDLAKSFKVTATTSYGEFNSAQNNYQRIFTYTIDLAIRPDIDPVPDNQGDSNSRVAAYIENDVYKRAYKYMFTGQNTDVIDVKFDLNLYYRWAVSAYEKRFIETSHSVDNAGREYEDSKDTQFQKKMPTSFPQGLPNLLAPITQFFNSGNLVEKLGSKLGLSQMINKRVEAKTSPEKSRSGVAVLEDPKQSAQSRIVNDVLSRAIYCPMNNIAEIELTIVGDPVWMDDIDLSTTLQSSDFSDKTTLIRFDMLSGQPHSDSTGLPAEIGRVNFNGYYFITSVLSTFENGVFRQELKGIIDPTTLEAGSIIPDSMG